MKSKPTYILGLSYFGNHESSAALLKNGILVAAAEEERFSRNKFDRSFPQHAIAFCLAHEGITSADINEVGFFWQPWRGIGTRMRYALAGVPASIRRSGKNTGILLDLFRAEKTFRKKTGYTGPFHYIEHHLAHVASAYFSSNFDQSALLSVDGTGEVATCWIGKAEGVHIRKITETNWPHSLGHLYATATQYLGFAPFGDEYKVMGLAAYGTPLYIDTFRKMIRTEEGRLVVDFSYTGYHLFKEQWYSKRWLQEFGPARTKDAPIEEYHRAVAASIQLRTEEIVRELAHFAVTRSGCTSLSLAGGVALNAVAVGAIADAHIAKSLYINPVSGDAGTALGAALYVHHVLKKQEERHPLPHALWGPEFSAEEVRSALERARLPYTQVENPAESAAQLLAEGLLVGWFEGRAEYGQRALGARSILADPRDPTMRDRINASIKHRESFRPFAPAILEDHQHEFFEYTTPVPFMTEVHSVRKERQTHIPAVVHVDGTARLQTVSKAATPLFYNLIEAFYKKTGVPLVLNTSFNVSGEPIVGSPYDAIATFQKANLDALLLGEFLVRRANARQ